MSELLGAALGVGPAAELRHDQPRDVPDDPGIDVLIAAVDLQHRRAVHSAFVCERGATDVRLVVVGRDVDDLGNVARKLGQVREPAGRQDLPVRLERQVGEDAHQVGVAAPFAVAVNRALDVADPVLHRGQRVRYRELGVVVDVDAPHDFI